MKNLREKYVAEISDEFSGAICLKTLVLLDMRPRIVQINVLVLFMRFVRFVNLFWPLNSAATQILAMRLCLQIPVVNEDEFVLKLLVKYLRSSNEKPASN